MSRCPWINRTARPPCLSQATSTWTILCSPVRTPTPGPCSTRLCKQFPRKASALPQRPRTRTRLAQRHQGYGGTRFVEDDLAGDPEAGALASNGQGPPSITDRLRSTADGAQAATSTMGRWALVQRSSSAPSSARLVLFYPRKFSQNPRHFCHMPGDFRIFREFFKIPDPFATCPGILKNSRNFRKSPTPLPHAREFFKIPDTLPRARNFSGRGRGRRSRRGSHSCEGSIGKKRGKTTARGSSATSPL